MQSFKLFALFIQVHLSFLITQASAGEETTKPPASEIAVYGGLSWLAKHQSEGGVWKGSRFIERCSPDKCNGQAETGDENLALTGIAILAFQGRGITYKRGPGAYKKCAKETIKFLNDRQKQAGRYPEGSERLLYTHAICTLAVCEAFGLSGKSKLIEPMARGAVSHLLASQNADGGWGLEGKSNVVWTAWASIALKAGMICEIEVPEKDIVKALDWLTFVTDAGTGKAGYTSKNDQIPLPKGSRKNNFGRLVAITPLTRYWAE